MQRTLMTRHQARRNAFLLLFQLAANPQGLEDLWLLPDEFSIETEDYMLAAERADGEKNQTPEVFCISVDEFGRRLLEAVGNHLEDIDAAIRPHLKGWTLARLPRVSLAALRLSCAELLYLPDLPASVIINEAVELAKQYGAEDEYAFVNGALRNISAAVRPQEA